MSNYIKAMDVDNDPICEIKEETKHAPHIEDFKPAEEIERLQNINADLLEACKIGADLWHDGSTGLTCDNSEICPFCKAIAKAEGRE
jgi:hypothetical protein